MDAPRALTPPRTRSGGEHDERWRLNRFGSKHCGRECEQFEGFPLEGMVGDAEPEGARDLRILEVEVARPGPELEWPRHLQLDLDNWSDQLELHVLEHEVLVGVGVVAVRHPTVLHQRVVVYASRTHDASTGRT